MARRSGLRHRRNSPPGRFKPPHAGSRRRIAHHFITRPCGRLWLLQATGVLGRPGGVLLQATGVLGRPGGVLLQAAGVLGQPGGVLLQASGVLGRPGWSSSPGLRSSRPARWSSSPGLRSSRPARWSSSPGLRSLGRPGHGVGTKRRGARFSAPARGRPAPGRPASAASGTASWRRGRRRPGLRSEGVVDASLARAMMSKSGVIGWRLDAEKTSRSASRKPQVLATASNAAPPHAGRGCRRASWRPGRRAA